MTQKTAVVGYPIAQSKSPLIHNALYKNENIDAQMSMIEDGNIENIVATIRSTPLALTAVTIPHKQTIMPFLDNIDDEARMIGSVNTVINRDGVLTGYNTDITGVEATLENVRLRGARTLVIGSGGVAQPIAYLLQREGANWYCNGRDQNSTVALCNKFGGKYLVDTSPPDGPWQLIINATPVGMHDDNTPVDESNITSEATVFDVIYNPIETRLLRESRAKGANTINGLKMFVAQALQQENLWLNKKFTDNDYTKLVLESMK